MTRGQELFEDMVRAKIRREDQTAEIKRLRAVADKARAVIDHWHDIPDVADHAHALIEALEAAGYSSDSQDTGPATESEKG